MSAKHEKAFSDLRTERFVAAEATALQAGTPALQSHPPPVAYLHHKTFAVIVIVFDFGG